MVLKNHIISASLQDSERGDGQALHRRGGEQIQSKLRRMRAEQKILWWRGRPRSQAGQC
jgi:hypothetical protein